MKRYLMSPDGFVFTASGDAQAPAGYEPVVVIDPEDEAQVGVLLSRFDYEVTVTSVRDMQRALRSLIAPPRAEVPERGWGRNATVRDRAAREWRFNTWTGRWYRLTASDDVWTAWVDLDVATDGILWSGAYDEETP